MKLQFHQEAEELANAELAYEKPHIKISNGIWQVFIKCQPKFPFPFDIIYSLYFANSLNKKQRRYLL